MPRWWVSEPYINVQVADEPLSYNMSSGQRMSFKWTHQQRMQLSSDADLQRYYHQKPPLVQTRLDLRTISSFGSYYNPMTNAAWCHNWWSEIVFWDPYLESHPPSATNSGHSPLFSMTFNYQGFALLGDGGVIKFTQANELSATSSLQTRVQVIGQTSYLNGPQVPVSFLDTNNNWVVPYPTNSDGLVWANPQYGLSVQYPDGSRDLYALALMDQTDAPYNNNPTPVNTSRAFLTHHIDPQGRTTTLGYLQLPVTGGQPVYVLRYVVDPDGRTNTYSYNTNDYYQLTQIQDPYGRTASFTYSYPNDLLTSITDAAGMTNSFQYQPPTVASQNGVNGYFYSGWISNLVTPYGTTAFTYYEQQEAGATTEYERRAVLVSEPNAAHQLFLYTHTNSNELDLPATNVPSVASYGFDDGAVTSPGGLHPNLAYRNTYHWGRRQFADTVSSLNLNASWLPPYGSLGNGLSTLVAADYNKAHLKHWLLDSSDTTSYITITDWISSERDPSPDAAGLTLGPRTWYSYYGQTPGQYYLSGSDPLIGCIARQLPDGTFQYETREHDSSSGNLTRQRLSYSRSDGTVGELTNTFTYGTNKIDVLSVSNSVGQWVKLAYNTTHQPTFVTNALNQVASFVWDNWTHNLTSLQLPSGLSLSLAYQPYGSDAGLLQSISWPAVGRTLAFTHNTNSSLPATVQTTGTGIPDLWTTNTWDGLDRLTGVAFPDGTSISNVYDRLYVGASKDRLNHWTYFGYDALEHVTSVTDALSNVTQYAWCDCGALTSIIDALTNITSLSYNNQGLLTNVLFPDNSKLNYSYDSIGRVGSVADGLGRALAAGYNNQGLVTVASNAFGPVQSLVFDAVGRPVQVSDANGVVVTNQYDLVNRVTARVWADNIAETYGWATNGLIAYTNRDGKVTRFARDAAGRLTSVTNANNEVTQVAYNSIGETTDLWDGRTNHTTWTYNEYGWLTNKTDALGRTVSRLGYDANGGLTNRWTPEKGNTSYVLDALGNVLTITYPLSSINYSYDALGQLKKMVDATGTNSFGWTPAGRLLNETGPWPSDTLSYGYTEGLRTSMSVGLQASPINYAYDSAWRLQSLASPAGTFGYGYGALSPASALVQTLSLPNAATITNHYDSLARLDYTALVSRYGPVLDGYGYVHDPLGLRTNITRCLGLTTNSVTVGFDNIGQITSWAGSELSGTSRLNEQLSFGYDPAHNLLSRTNGGLIQTFICDPANQLTNISRTGPLTVSGATPSPASNVTVNGTSAQLYGDWTFAATNFSLLNGQNSFTNIALSAGGTRITNVQTANLPQSLTLQFDGNGNLTNDGTRTFGYGPENELTNIAVAGAWKSDFVYDGLGRRRIARDYGWSSGTWQLTNETRFIYDGFLLIQERDSNNVVRVNYTRGLDLSGSLSGAGGIGGLLARTDSGGSTFYHADGGGNITAMVDGNDYVAARYLYNPFGALIGRWGRLADANVMQFSSMPHHRSGLSFYPFRAYDPSVPHWLSRDPIGELGGINLYAFARNNPLRYVDPWGFEGVEEAPEPAPETAPRGLITQEILDELQKDIERDVSELSQDTRETLTDQLKRDIKNGDVPQNLELRSADPKDSKPAERVAKNFPLSGLPNSTPCPSRLRDPTTGRFIPDPKNPKSPYTFTDAQRRAEWKRLANDPTSPLTAEQRKEIEERGWRGPQQINDRTGDRETMELSHEPIPLREGGTQVVPRWPDDHAAVDPHRFVK